MLFVDNYFHEIPADIQMLIITFTKYSYYDIYVTVSTNSNLKKRKKFVSKSMHKRIMNLSYYHKNVSTDSNIFCDRYKNAYFTVKEHIRDIISKLKISHINDILLKNNIHDAKNVYKMIYGDRKNIINYDIEMLLEYILNVYKTTIDIRFIS
jgi:hypothetical protein